ncbi:MAG TPA: hypothetical protein VHL79_19205 [Ramlibacter sp.]|jgi:hypothetical protein|nr:hypothetical protein [Ramlibacter sp.]
METFNDGGQAGQRPGSQGAAVRPGQSGEGSRSALEQLIQQEKKRDAQLPRDAGGVGGETGASA